MPRAKTKKKQRKRRKQKDDNILVLTFRRPHVNLIIDRILFFRFIRQLHGRFWGVSAAAIMAIGFGICFAIKPENFAPGIAISEFGNDVRTAPYFAGSMFFGAYGLWRWRNYLSRTLQRERPVLGLTTLTIVGFYLVALMPISWKPWPYRIHMFGMILAGVCMAATVVFDILLTRTRKSRYEHWWQFVRFGAFFLICLGGWLTLGSAQVVRWYQLSLVGELLMFSGYATWIVMKTYLGEGSRSFLSRWLHKIVLVD